MIFMTIMCFFRQNMTINVTRISQYRHENHHPKLTKKHEKSSFHHIYDDDSDIAHIESRKGNEIRLQTRLYENEPKSNMGIADPNMQKLFATGVLKIGGIWTHFYFCISFQRKR